MARAVILLTTAVLLAGCGKKSPAGNVAAPAPAAPIVKSSLTDVYIDGGWRYVDASGTVVIPGPFTRAGRFAEGLAAASVGGPMGFIDETGKFVIQPQFEDAGWFSDGLADVRVGGKCGYIDKTGTMVIPAIYDVADPFINGQANVGFAKKTLADRILPTDTGMRVDRFAIDKQGNRK